MNVRFFECRLQASNKYYIYMNLPINKVATRESQCNGPSLGFAFLFNFTYFLIRIIIKQGFVLLSPSPTSSWTFSGDATTLPVNDIMDGWNHDLRIRGRRTFLIVQNLILIVVFDTNKILMSST